MFLNQLSQYPRDVVSTCVLFTLPHDDVTPCNAITFLAQTDPGPPHYDPSNPNHSKPLTQAQKSPPFLSSATRNDKMSTKFFTGNHVSAKMQFTVNVLYKVYSVFALSYFSRRTRWVRVDMMCRSLKRENTETATLIISNRKPDVSIQPKTSNSCTHSFYWVRSM